MYRLTVKPPREVYTKTFSTFSTRTYCQEGILTDRFVRKYVKGIGVSVTWFYVFYSYRFMRLNILFITLVSLIFKYCHICAIKCFLLFIRFTRCNFFSVEYLSCSISTQSDMFFLYAFCDFISSSSIGLITSVSLFFHREYFMLILYKLSLYGTNYPFDI